MFCFRISNGKYLNKLENKKNNIIKMNTKPYHKHLEAYEYFKQECRDYSRTLADAEYINEHEALCPRFVKMEYLNDISFKHRRSYELLKKVDSGISINKNDYDNELLIFINKFRRLNWSEKYIYEKLDEIINKNQ
ncbi:hypothetical protein QKU48_gp0578 [Fadolivirus algeromassiliense]|jgi:hypothetical protein|uniref:Uncharacterized protein n=1 Tax=Fadolivirus FV1/VV64 TaxID=3070911 RepID=A0A7D3V7L0_9VIRU|nr:hypothetical protein QKU48_gp0578 [Fadolivirus algeromassiliense]QKF94036.1 hypothetical protein Fadolivirus_1_578 [Fadolivirus FV1/VV64]